MVKTLTLKNSDIYSYANNILENFQEDVTLPVKINFYLQKNIKAIVTAAQEIEQERMKIMEAYGTKSEDGTQYTFEPDVVDKANKELTDLFDIEQDIKVYMLELDWFDDIELTSSQFSAISYMFNDEEE